MSWRFDIAFEGESWTDEDGSWRTLRLTLDEFVEGHYADLSHWSERDYQAQWLEELNAIAGSKDRGALITSIHDPSNAYRIWVWPMWKDGDKIHFQNRLLFMLEPEPKFDPTQVSRFIGEHRLLNEDGEPFSQWTITISAVREFLTRQKNLLGEICSTPS